MSKLMKWTKVLEGKGIRVIDNTQTIDEVEDGEVKRIHTMPEPTKNGSIVLPAQSKVDDALAMAAAAREATYDIEPSKPVLITPPAKGQVPFETEPSDPVSFNDLADMAQDPVVAEENLVVTVVEKVFDSTEPQGWDEFVSEAQEPTHERLPDFPPETPIVYVNLDVPEGIELIIKINGQELL